MALLPKLRSAQNILGLLLAAWFLVFLYFEHAVPVAAAGACKWSHMSNQTNVLLVADPQLIDNHTYPGRNEMLLLLSKHTVDVYLKKNYRALVNSLKPDYIMFLGDYLDNGRLLQDAYYENEFGRFEDIFNRWPQYQRGVNMFTDVPGNHDVGFGDRVKESLQLRFLEHFGAPNKIRNLNGVEFVLLDTPSYLSTNRLVNFESRLFVGLLPKPKVPRILLSHVPLFRDPAEFPCGLLRENPKFNLVAGYQYQTALESHITTDILSKVQPTLVFSGDDHDYCDVVHPGNVREVTVKSISMAMGINYPAVQLLTYSTDKPEFQYDTHMCYLPTPYVSVYAYVVMAVISAVVLMAWSIKQRSGRYNYLVLPSWEENTDAILMEPPASMSQKVSNFLKEQDVGSKLGTPVSPLPKYTHATESPSEFAIKKLGHFQVWIKQFWRKWNLQSFFKNCAVLGPAVILLYNFVVRTI